jgi:hypothetical protein
VYIAASFLWLWLIEKQALDKWDSIGAVLDRGSYDLLWAKRKRCTLSGWKAWCWRRHFLPIELPHRLDDRRVVGLESTSPASILKRIFVVEDQDLAQSDPKLFQAAANDLIAKGYAPQGIMAVYVKSRRESANDGVTVYEYEYAQAFWLPRSIEEHSV